MSHIATPVASLNDLDDDFPGWHCWWSYNDHGDPARVNATHIYTGTELDEHCGSEGIVLDTATPGQMRDLLARRTA